MSAPMKLNARQLERFAGFLADISKASRLREVRAGAYGPIDVEVDDVAIQVSWDKEAEQYIIDDRVGD